MTMTTTTVVPSCHATGEVCPLCFERYAGSAEQICVSCEAPSCPDCAEPVRGSDDVLCYACRPPTH